MLLFFSNNFKFCAVKKNLSNHATKADLKKATAVDKSDIGELDTDNLKNAPSCLSSLNCKVDK